MMNSVKTFFMISAIPILSSDSIIDNPEINRYWFAVLYAREAIRFVHEAKAVMESAVDSLTQPADQNPEAARNKLSSQLMKIQPLPTNG